MRTFLRKFGMVLLPLLAAEGVRAADTAGIEFFESKIRPVLAENCYSCHSAEAKKLKANFRLDTREGLLKGGESEMPGVAPGKVEESHLIQAVRWDDESLRMPPKKKLADNQIADLEAWVKMGAPMPAAKTQATAVASSHPTAMTLAEGRKFWSFVLPREQAVPDVDPGNGGVGKDNLSKGGLGVSPEHSSAASDQSSGGTPKPLSSKPRNEIDRFLLAKLAQQHLSFSPAADKRTLLRRVTYDLLGLPPTVREIKDFTADASPDAFEKVVDRLLASPHYGERWGRHWLDVARYADTKGYVFDEERRYAFSFTYRDWVVRALNEDLPYDQFLVQQIAADRLDRKGDNKPLAALGFLTLGRRFLNNPADIIDDRIDVVCRGTMALTVSCARCHDHKYDPIPSADYYSLYGVFASTNEPAELPLLGAAEPAKAAEFEAELAKRKAELETFTNKRYAEVVAGLHTKELIAGYLLAAQKNVEPAHVISEDFEVPDDTKKLSPWMTRRWEAYLKAQAPSNDGVFQAWRRLSGAEKNLAATAEELARTPSINPIIARFVLAAPAPKSMTEVANRYAAAIVAFDGKTPQPDPAIEAVRLVLNGPDAPANTQLADAEHLFGNVDRMKKRGLKAAIDTHIATHPGSPLRAMAVEDAPQPVTPHIFKRGNPTNLGAEVPRQMPAILVSDERKPFTSGSGRLELARAIASQSNPLTARVIVNRVWQYHFGVGLVRTPSDFGTRGSLPTHPELLDWLALRFMNEDGWSLKKLHRRIVLSAAYQQASIDRPDARDIDPENKLVWRQNPQRLDFESMRDSLLAASGAIDLAMGGRSVDILAQPFVPRRSIYAFIDRQNLPGLFRTFDFASPDATSAQRFTTSVPQQALFMMNSPFAIEQAKKLAARKDVADQPDAAARIGALYRFALGRAPTPQEADLAARFVQTEQAQPAKVEVARATQWSYGWGEFDEASGRVTSFTKFPHFNAARWDGSEKLPDATLGYAALKAGGGHPGNDLKHATIRRFTAPRDCAVAIDGKLAHEKTQGDGVRGRIVSSREGALATWQIQNKSADTRIAGITLKQGDTLDFIVDCGSHGNYRGDTFSWNVTITKRADEVAAAGDDTGSTWDSVADFSGPAGPSTTPLNAWGRLAQVLLESNEFTFVD